jgi:hypothetical protein
MDCRIVEVEQNTDEWSELRACRITASRLADVCAKHTTKRYKAYLHEMVLELLGHRFVEDRPEWYAHGRELEPRALGALEWKYNEDLNRDLFLIHNKYDWLGCSPDAMSAGFHEGYEIKCRKMYKNYLSEVQFVQSNAGSKVVPYVNRHQIQGAMWVSGLQHWWYVNYYESQKDGQRKLNRVQVPRDDTLIFHMELKCLEFMHEAYDLAQVEGRDY